MTNRTRTDVLLLAGFCAFLFFYGLNQFGLIGADEPRYAQVAREMLERHDWITPVLNGRQWLEKPPLYYWQAMIAYAVFGVSDWSARLPSAFDATLLVLAIYFFLRKFRRGFELDAALITAACAGIIAYSRAASMDMVLTTVFTIGMLGWWGWHENEGKYYLALFYAAMALGTLAKGPVAPVLGILTIAFYAAAIRERRVITRTLWIPGIVLFCAISLPWYFTVQSRNPIFFHEFIVQHNLERFSENLYHHTEPFWYYLPVTALAVVPWTVFVSVAAVGLIRRLNLKSHNAGGEIKDQFGFFALCWLIATVIFFSISQSKLPGYILPAVPAAALLLTSYLGSRLETPDPQPVAKWLAILHGLVAAVPIVPGLLIAYILQQHRMPNGRPLITAVLVAFILWAGIALTLISRAGLRMLRFVTLVPILLTVGTVLKLGSTDLDQSLSARPLAVELISMETHPLPLAIYRVRRELEYGLNFYFNQQPSHYDWGEIPKQEHLLVAPENSQAEIARLAPGRRISYLGHFAPQHVDYYWVAAAAAPAR